MSARRITLSLLCLLAALLPATEALGAEAKPAWLLSATALPTNFAPGSEGTEFGGPTYLLVATNVGGAPTTGTTTITDTLPPGLTPIGAKGNCQAPVGQTVTCTEPNPLAPGDEIELSIVVKVDASEGASLLNEASVQSPGAATATITTPTTISASPPPFGFLAGFRVPLSEADGEAATLAGSHPYQLSASLGFPTEKPAGGLGGAGHLRDASIDFPPGQIINPTATPVLCTEAELTGEPNPGCPKASQLGTIDIITVPISGPQSYTSPLYNMVPPPGQAAMLGFDAIGSGIFVHLSGAVRSDGDYGITGASADALALVNNPIFGAQVQLWGDPSAKSHDEMRGKCLGMDRKEEEEKEKEGKKEDCTVPPRETALLTMPSHCPGRPNLSVGHADSWEAPGVFEQASYESASLAGAPVSVKGCGQLAFDPAIKSRPTTNLTDSPSGLDFALRMPQEVKLGTPSPAALRDATVTLPEGLVVNPSSAAGQEACSSAQIGLTTPIGQSPVHFSKAPVACPDAAKVGTLEATTPLLAQIDPTTNEVRRDPESGEAIRRAVEGSVYLARPFDNPFGSLLAIYLTVEDPRSGTVAKFAGRVRANPQSGQLSTEVSENPQLPLDEIDLHIFAGARASLRTPPACGANASAASLVPWSAPEAPAAQRSDSFATTAAPDGGACPTSPAAAPHKPALIAGTLTPAAGAFSPMTARLTREDGSQPITGLELTLPPGLSARLAGVPYCGEAQIAAAQARSHPNEGKVEQANPSCPAASQLGMLDVAAGAGPTPLHTPGHIYLAGPYKGAPLSAVAITPAVAGPFDLGVVVSRAALYLDPTTAQARVVSDPLPSILEGIPLDVRSVSLRIDRPRFTLNPTSCDPSATTGAATSIFGQIAALRSPFQVGGCKALPYKPKLHTRLFGPIHRGGHPRFRAVFTAKPGEANTARIVLALPSSEFIDQAHFRTICTRVQFAAKQCPPGSIYGHVKAITPLLDYPLQGPIYLRSSDQELPDAVAALRGPPSQPLEFDAVTHVDSVNGGLRFTVPTVPDAPLTKVIITAQGAKKGLFQNSTNICKGVHRANLKLDGQNGKAHDTRPLMRADCPKPSKKKGGRHHR